MEHSPRIIKTVIDEYYRKEWPNVTRHRKLLNTLRKKNRITYNHSGKNRSWKVLYKENPLQWVGHDEPITAARSSKYQEATLPWRSCVITDQSSKFEELVARGAPVIVNAISDIGKRLLKDFDSAFSKALYVDGNATGNTKKIHGLNSCMGTNGAHANTFTGEPSDTYAGLSTVLGNYGGTWTGTWPDGEGSTQYDFWSPLVVDYSGAGWLSSGTDWASNGFEAIRYMGNKQMRNGQGVEMHLLAGEMFRSLQNAVDPKEQVNVTRSNNDELHFGTGQVMYIDGMPVTWEYGITAGEGFALNFDEIELCCMLGQLVELTPPDWVWETRIKNFAAQFFGNMTMNPRHVGKYTASV